MIVTSICCDKCGKQLTYLTAVGSTCMKSLARKGGWSVGKQHLCPNCRKKKRSMPTAYKEGEHE